jgi:hypothetical protein
VVLVRMRQRTFCRPDLVCELQKQKRHNIILSFLIARVIDSEFVQKRHDHFISSITNHANFFSIDKEKRKGKKKQRKKKEKRKKK